MKSLIDRERIDRESSPSLPLKRILSLPPLKRILSLPPLKKGGRGGFLLLLTAILLSACSTAPTVKTAPGAAAVEISEAARQRYQEALALMHGGQTKQAEAILLAMTRDYPRLAGPYVNLGIIYQRSGRAEAAEQALRKAIELRPSHAAAYNELGILYRESGRFDEAAEAYRQALKADPDYADAHLNLGILLDIYLQRPAEALAHYEAYQKLQAKEDKTVKLWIIDLKRRLEEQP